ncbi:MAG: AAA family ATPase [Gemmatimonadota bacterium]|nr:AAA family ATPase [Gemmatimonadota bacterium]
MKTPQLESVTIRGFRSIEAVDALPLGAVNVLVGPNGSGKSNFIGAFSFLHAVRDGKLQEYVARAGGADSVLYFGSSSTTELRIKLSFAGGTNAYDLLLVPTDTGELVPRREIVSFWDKAHYPQPYGQLLSPLGKEAGISGTEQDGIASYVRRHLAKWRVYHFHDTGSRSALKRTSDVADNRFLRSDGSNLPSFLYLLSERYPDSFRVIVAAIRLVAPFLDRFHLEPEALNAERMRLEWVHRDSDAFFDVSSLSDGTLRFIALTTLLLQPVELRPSVILIDEPELGLHPYAIAMLAGLIRQSSAETQVIVSTQSPILLDHFEPEEVIVADFDGKGTSFRRLLAGELESWLSEYSLGELWQKDQFGGRPH